MNELELKMCDIQGRLFELSGVNGYDSVPFIKAFMTGDIAKGLDSKFNRLQWAGEEYLLAELADTAELTKRYFTGRVIFTDSGTLPPGRVARKYTSKPQPKPWAVTG